MMPAEREPAFLERLLPQRLAVEEQQVEGVEHGALGPVTVEVGLQFGERGSAAIVEDHRFAVDDGRADLQRRGGAGDRRKARRPVVAVAGADRRLAAGDVGRDAIPVPLDLVHPLRADRRLVDERRQARPDPLRQRLVEQPGLAGVGRLGDDCAIGDDIARRVGLSLDWAPRWRSHRATMAGAS